MTGLYSLVRPSPESTVTNLVRNADGAVIPQDPANRDYQVFLTAGVTPDPAPTVVTKIVIGVSATAIRYVMRHAPDPKGVLPSVLLAFEAALTDPDMLDAWKTGGTIYRSDLLAIIASIGTTIGVGAARVDVLLTAAAARPNSGAVYGFP